MESLAIQAGQRRYFHFNAPAAAVGRAFGFDSLRRVFSARGSNPVRRPTLLIELERGKTSPLGCDFQEQIPVEPFPNAACGLIRLMKDKTNDPPVGVDIDLLLPRTPFDKVADHCGAERLGTLNLLPGVAAEDEVLDYLGECLFLAVTVDYASSKTLDQLVLALYTHLAERYGALRVPPVASQGCLNRWQLRIARRHFETGLNKGISRSQVAQHCGLSLSHFSRAFTKSTGFPPHRWIMKCRVEKAKMLLEKNAMPLAEIAVTCGFYDQSHFTRAFSAATGFTPRRWRADRVIELSMSDNA